MRQHLAAVLAAAEVADAEVGGAALGSRRLVFRPGPVRAGELGPTGCAFDAHGVETPAIIDRGGIA